MEFIGSDSNSINLWLIAVPLALALLIAAIVGWRQEMARRQRRRSEVTDLAAELAARNAPLPVGSVLVNASDQTIHGDRSGRIMFVFDGSFSAAVGAALLVLLSWCGLDRVVGSILLIELDGNQRRKFFERLPAIFRDRLVSVDLASLAGGGANRSPQEMLSFINRWGPAVRRSANEVCDRHQRLQLGAEPALVLLFLSLGGQAILATEALNVIKSKFRLAKMVGFTAIPTDDRLRQHFQFLRQIYTDIGVQGFVVSDNLGDVVRNDFGMIAAIAGFVASTEHADSAVELNNGLTVLFDDHPGGLVSYSTHVADVPGYRVLPTHPRVPPRYVVYQSAVTSAMASALEDVRRPDHHALHGLGGETPVPLTSRFDIVLTAVRSDHLKPIEDDINEGESLLRADKRNHHLLVAPIGTVVDPERPSCPVVAVALHAIHEPDRVASTLSQPFDLSRPLDVHQLNTVTHPARSPQRNGAGPAKGTLTNRSFK